MVLKRHVLLLPLMGSLCFHGLTGLSLYGLFTPRPLGCQSSVCTSSSILMIHEKKPMPSPIVPTRKKIPLPQKSLPLPHKKTPLCSSFSSSRPPLPEASARPTSPENISYVIGSKNNPAPPYPFQARRQKRQGRVVLHATVTDEGTISQLEISSSSGHAILDEAAFKTVKQWIFLVKRKHGVSQPRGVFIPIHFKLQELEKND